MPTCRTCGAELPEGARFCPACGTPVGEPSGGGRERKLVTVLFADVTGSTTLGERLDPERMREVMDTFFAAMRDEIEMQGGTVEKFIGDAVMAAFGVPVAHEDDPARALRAALRMLERLETVNRGLARDHDVTLEVRIGVNTGDVLASTDPRPGEPMVTGDAVNAAARLEAAATPGEILAAERTVRAVRGFRTADAGELELKGKAEPVRAFRVLEETTVLPQRGVPGLHAPLVGREDELELLGSIISRVRGERRPHLVTVYGDAGVGKSRLTREFLATLEEDALVLTGRCLPYGEGVTFWPLAEILKAHAGVLDTDPPDLALERIRKMGRELLTEDLSADPARTTGALAFTVGVEDPEFAFARMDPKEVRAEVHAAWRSLFSALAVTRTVVVLVEDIHWADPALLDLLEDLAERTVGPVLFVCPSRPELTARRPTWGGGRRNHTSVALDPLTPDQSERLVGFLLAIDDLPPAIRRRILERAEGNPFFLEEIIRHLIDEGFLVHHAGRWRAAAGIEDVEIPDTVQGVLAARIDLLEPEQKQVLQTAAVVGRIFWPGPIRELLGAAEVDETLRALESRELVLSRLGSSITGEPEFIFKHILTRDVAYASLPRRERSPAHSSVATWLERTAGARTREFVELLAYHYATAVAEADGSAEDFLRRKAFEYLVAASVESRSKQVLRKAERLAEEALQLAVGDVERATALETLGDAFGADYQGDLAWRYFREAAHALAAAPGHDHDPRVAYLCARAAEFPTRWPGSMRAIPGSDEVEPIVELGTAHLPDGDSEERVRLQALRSSWPFAFPGLAMGRDEALACEAAGLEAAEMAMRLGRPDLASAAFDAASGYAISLGLYERVLDIQRRRLEVAAEISDFELGDLFAMFAWAHHELGHYEEALAMCEEGLRRTGGRSGGVEIHMRAWRSVLEYRLADWEAAISTFEEIRAFLDERRDDPPYFATHAFASTAMIFDRRGETVESDRLTDLLRPLATGFSARLLPWLVRLLVERGEVDEARRLLRDLPDAWRVHTPDLLEARCEFVAASSAWDEVPVLLDEARAYAEESGARATPLFAARLDGRASLAAGRSEEAARILSGVVDGFGQLGARYERAITQLDLARALVSSGDAGRAREQLDDAAPVLEDLRAVRMLARLRALRAELPS